jgi:endonuclease/exonuclease/phosphatase family metal-dependent hydrolase
MKNCLSETASGVYFYTSEQDKFFNQDVKEYNHDTLMLNGFEIQNFRIVYPAKDDKWESEQAFAIRDAIAKDTGWYIAAVPDSVACNGELEILVGKTNRKGNFTSVGDSTTLGGVQIYRSFVNVGGNNAAANVVGAKLMLEAIKAASQNQIEDTPTIKLETKTQSIFKDDHSVSAMSFNVWVGGISANPTRKEVAAEQIKQMLPDTVGLQEASVAWYQYFVEVFSDYYTIVGFGRESGDCDFEKGTAGANAGEGTFVMIAKDKYDLKKTQTFWLSDKPTTPQSQYSGQSYLRVVTWAELTRKSDGKEFVHCNTHIDFGDIVQTKQVAQILNYMKPYVEANVPVIITGDFNMTINAVAFRQFAPAGFTSSEFKATQVGIGGNTFPNKHPNEYSDPTTRIDFLMVTDNIKVSYYTVLRQPINGLNVSDHYPVYMEFNY